MSENVEPVGSDAVKPPVQREPEPAASPDKAAVLEADAGRRHVPSMKPASHRGRALWSAIREELYADNAFTVTFLAILLALVCGAVLMVLGNEQVRQQWSYLFYQPGRTLAASWDFVASAYSTMFENSVFNPDTVNRWYWGMATWQQALRPISETLTRAAPLIFTGLAVALPFRAGLFNIGGQGQAIMGAIGGATVGIMVGAPGWIVIPVALLAAAALGGGWGLMVGVLKARTGAHEVILTIMLNYIAIYFLGWFILQDGIKNPDRPDAISKPVHDSAMFPKLFDLSLRANLGIILAVVSAAAVAWLLRRGTFGFELRAVGHNPDAARTAGIKVGRTLAMTMGISGVLAALGGVTMVLGTESTLTGEVIGQIGFNGILVALLGRVKPWGVVWAGLLFGALQAGGNAMQTFNQVSNELVLVIQALIVIFVAAPILVKAIFRLRKSPSAAAQAALAKG